MAKHLICFELHCHTRTHARTVVVVKPHVQAHELSMATLKKQKVKNLKASEVQAISRSICKPTSTIATLILQSLKTSRHILLYPERTELCKLLEVELFEEFSQLVSCLVEDYCELYKLIKGRTKYSDFQVKWLDHVYPYLLLIPWIVYCLLL